jgi:predicted DNA-binding transcriptional regulator AlpA
VSCDGGCAACGGLVARIDALESKIAKLEAGAAVERAPSAGVLGIAELEERFGADRSTINRWIRSGFPKISGAGNFPAPVSYAGNRRRWRLADIEKWEAEQAARKHEPIIRGVVAQRRAEAQGASRAV